MSYNHQILSEGDADRLSVKRSVENLKKNNMKEKRRGTQEERRKTSNGEGRMNAGAVSRVLKRLRLLRDSSSFGKN